MGRYLVTFRGPSMKMEDLGKGFEFWQEILKEFPDVRSPHVLGSLVEGEVVCIIEASSIGRIREVFDRHDQLARERGIYKETETETGRDILPLEFQYDGTELVYKRELQRV